jgi:hypothetical protein
VVGVDAVDSPFAGGGQVGLDDGGSRPGPARVRQVPPLVRCWILTGRRSRSAWLLVNAFNAILKRELLQGAHTWPDKATPPGVRWITGWSISQRGTSLASMLGSPRRRGGRAR